MNFSELYHLSIIVAQAQVTLEWGFLRPEQESDGRAPISRDPRRIGEGSRNDTLAIGELLLPTRRP